MDEQTQALKINRRRTRAEIEQLVAEYEASGVGLTVFCQRRGLSLSTLSRDRRRQEQTAGEGAEGKRWLAVEVTGSVAGVGDERPAARRLCFWAGGGSKSAGFDGDTLKRLLAAVERG